MGFREFWQVWPSDEQLVEDSRLLVGGQWLGQRGLWTAHAFAMFGCASGLRLPRCGQSKVPSVPVSGARRAPDTGRAHRIANSAEYAVNGSSPPTADSRR